MADANEKGGAKEAREAKDVGELAAPVAEPGGLKRAMPFLIGGTLSIGLGITSGIVTQPHDPEPEVSKEAEPVALTPLDRFLKPHTFALPTLRANLADGGQPASCMVNLFVEIRAKEMPTQVALEQGCTKGGQLYPVVRDALVMLLSSKQSAELKTPRGREVLKLEILDKLAPILFPDPGSGVITGVYFDELLLG